MYNTFNKFPEVIEIVSEQDLCRLYQWGSGKKACCTRKVKGKGEVERKAE